MTDIEQRIQQIMDSWHLSYEVLPCDPELADTAAYCQHYGIPADRTANTIIVASKKLPRRYSACLVLADSRLDVNHTVSRLMNVSRLSFATTDEAVILTGMLAGGVTVFGLPDDWPIYVDSRLMERDWIIVGGGSRSSKIKVNPDQMLKVPNAVVVHGLATVRDGPQQV